MLITQAVGRTHFIINACSFVEHAVLFSTTSWIGTGIAHMLTISWSLTHTIFVAYF